MIYGFAAGEIKILLRSSQRTRLNVRYGVGGMWLRRKFGLLIMSRVTPDSRRGLGDEHYALIGCIIAEWSNFQSALAIILTELVIGRAIEHEDDFLSLTAFIGQNAGLQIDLLKVMGLLRLGDIDGERFGKALDKAAGIKKTRDRLAHGRIDPREKGLGLVVHNLKPMPKMKSEEVILSKQEIHNTIQNLHNCYQLILEILNKYGYMVHWSALTEKLKGQDS